MEKEYVGKFMAKDEGRTYKTDCKVILKEDKITMYYRTQKGIKSREYKADCIFSFEEERLIKISETKNAFPEVLLSFFGAIALVSNFWFGAGVIAFSFFKAILKNKKSYILLLNPVQKPILRLIRCNQTVSQIQRKAA